MQLSRSRSGHTILIILSRSPWAQNYDSVLAVAEGIVDKGGKVDVLLIQDACMAATIAEFCGRLAKKHIGVYALKADCEARGLTRKVNGGIDLIDYKEWVRLVMTGHEKIVSWTS